MKGQFGRCLYGAAAIAYGIAAFIGHHAHWWAYLIGAAQLAGGVLIEWRRTARIGSIIAGAAYVVLALLTVPDIIRGPLVYVDWGNFFEQFSLVTGALLIYAMTLDDEPRSTSLVGIGRILFGICTLSFGLEQAFYLKATAGLVPKWIPPGQMFWAVATTIAFLLAAIAIVSGIRALLAAQLTAAMLGLFALIVWVPILIAKPDNAFYWSEFIETVAISACALVLSEALAAYAPNRR